MKEICKTFFKMDKEIIDGYNIYEKSGAYYIDVYTTCKKLGNWQTLLKYNCIDKVIDYFNRIVKSDIEDNKSKSIWSMKEKEWRKNTLNLLLESV